MSRSVVPEARRWHQAPGSHDAPDVVGEYELGETIGQGSFGRVRVATHRETRAKYAIKLLFKHKIKGPAQIARVLREVRFLRVLDHPHIIKIVECFESEEIIYIVTEYAGGGELFDYIVSRGRLQSREARKFFRQLVSALDYCHQNHIIHRDLKPENMLLDDKTDIKVIDFGFSNVFKSNQRLSTFCGSPYYAAPEMNSGIEYHGPAADIWSAGIVLFACLTGQLPFDGKDINSLYMAVRRGLFRCPSFLQREELDLVCRMLQVNPENRITLAEIKKHPFVTDHGLLPEPNNFLPKRPPFRGRPSPAAVYEMLQHDESMTEEDVLVGLQDPTSHVFALYHLIHAYQLRLQAQGRLPPEIADMLMPGPVDASAEEAMDGVAVVTSPAVAHQLQANSRLHLGVKPINIDSAYSSFLSGAVAAAAPSPSAAPSPPAPAPKAPAPAPAPSAPTAPVPSPASAVVSPASAVVSPASAAVSPAPALPKRRQSVGQQLVEFLSSALGHVWRAATPPPHEHEHEGGEGDALHPIHHLHGAPTGADLEQLLQRPLKLSGLFTVSTTSGRPREALVHELEASLKHENLEHFTDKHGTFYFQDHTGDVMAQVAIVPLDRLHMHGVRFRRIRGSLAAYRQLAERIISNMRL